MQRDRAIARLDPPKPANAGKPPLAEAEVRVPRRLDSTAKAAIVVRLLLNEGADLPLEDLPHDLQARLTQQMGKMGLVDRVTLASVVHEFAEALDGVGLSFPHGLAGALSALDGKISPQTAARLRKEAGVRQAGDPWARLRAQSVADLAKMAQAESIEIAAVLLSKLDVAKAAELLGKLPGRWPGASPTRFPRPARSPPMQWTALACRWPASWTCGRCSPLMNIPGAGLAPS